MAGHRGMVVRAILRRLEQQRADGGATKLITCDRARLELREQAAVRSFIADAQPRAVLQAAAKVGGITAKNSLPAEATAENLSIQLNVIDGAHRAGVQRLLPLGSSCIYPKRAAQPMRRGALLSGTLKRTSETDAIAEIAGIKLCKSYNRQYDTHDRSVIPTNVYGPKYNFNHSHMLQSAASSVASWGLGKPRQQNLHVDNMAEASLFVQILPAKIVRAEPSRC